MGNNNTNQLLAGKAYRLFFNEYRERLDDATRLLKDGINSSTQGELQSRFHLLKGSAGFFGFDEIYRIASELEKLFGKSSQLTGDDLHDACAYLDSLEACGAQMPKPKDN